METVHFFVCFLVVSLNFVTELVRNVFVYYQPREMQLW